MKEEELVHLLALQKTKGVGDVVAKKLISAVGSATQVFKESPSKLAKLNGIGTITIANLKDSTILKKAEKELQYISSNKLKVLYFLDDAYPMRLKHCIDGPILMFQKGNTSFNDKKIISIVGTRNMTPYGKDCCEQLIDELSDYNPIIVSGLAYGVDICAHKSALKNRLETVAVLGNGFSKIYPSVHKKHASEIEAHGAIISEFWYHDEPLREHFLQRNRIIAGISEATIVIESADKGGSLVTADIADSYNRDVFAIPGRISDKYSKGCNYLIKQQKAISLTTAQDVIKELSWDIEMPKNKTIQPKLFDELSTDEQLIVTYLQNNGKQPLDLVSLHTRFTIQKTASLLFTIEMKGVVRALPGKLFEVI